MLKSLQRTGLTLVAFLAAGGAVNAQNTNDLGVVKTYLLTQVGLQKAATSSLKTAAGRYYDLAKAVDFDYAKLASEHAAEVKKTLLEARAAWMVASPVYESVEGIVSGVETMQIFDTNLDAGASKADGGDGVVTFDLSLPNGKTLTRPGNLFGVSEGTLWGSEKSYSSGVKLDLNGDGKLGFGDVLPDANVLSAAAAALDDTTAELLKTGNTWQPSVKDIVAALKTNVPTAANVFIERWKTSRFVLGDKSTRRDFNVISSLNDLEQNIGSWESLYTGLSGGVKARNAALDNQIKNDLERLKVWVVGLQTQEKAQHFTPEGAEIVAKEGQNRATAIVGKVVQAAALLSSAEVSTASQASDLAIQAEFIRSSLVTAQHELSVNREGASASLKTARGAFQKDLQKRLEVSDVTRIETAFGAASKAVLSGDEAGFAVARATIWTGLLHTAYTKIEVSVRAGDAASARAWLGVREFRQATRFTTPDTDATLALDALQTKKIAVADATTAVRADLLDAYQSRLSDALHDLETALSVNYRVQAAEYGALASGYFRILEPMYAAARGAASSKTANAAFALLSATPNLETLRAARAVLEGFRAAPMSPRERSKRANQTLRFLSLVAVEYGRAAKGPAGSVNIVKDLEVTEAATFRSSAASAFSDLEPLLVKLNKNAVTEAKAGFADLEAKLNAAARKDNPVTAESLSANVTKLTATLEALIPSDWRRADPAGDLEVVRQQLRQIELAAAQKSYDLAESARIGAYALLESGTEARIRFFQPQLATTIEALFWNGVEPDGLARLIGRQAPESEFRATRVALEAKLQEAATFVGTDQSPVAAFVNALVIVFREGLEAVLILAALLGSLKAPAVRHLRRPLWLGAASSFGATVLTFIVMGGILNAFAAYGEKLSAIVSVIAVAVLLVIMNWFFHNVYWNDHLANFHKKKHQLMGANVGQGVGLAILGFTAMYREGFETVLFLQSLVLQSGVGIVVGGALVALALVSVIGVLVFVMQTKLPHKKMLIATGGMICLVLFVIVGNTVHLLQVVGWFPIHPMPIALPYWAGLWLGTFATWEGVILQIVAVTFVVGSYFVAEGMKHREQNRRIAGSRKNENPQAAD